MKTTRKLISTLLVLAMVISSICCVGLTSASAAAPSFTVKAVTNLSYNNARINASISIPSGMKVDQIGFIIDSNQTNINNNKGTKKYDSKAAGWDRNTAKTCGFTLANSPYKVTLKASTTYYYKFFAREIKSKKLYYSSKGKFTTQAAPPTYKKIGALKISRIYQPKNDKTGSCYLSSVATLIAYKRGSGRTAGKDFTQGCAVYKEVYKKNGNTTYMYDKTLAAYGLKKQSYSLKNLYSALKAGKPAVIYSGKHASLVIAYKGNSNTLKASDFIVMEIKAIWKNSASLYNSYANKGENPKNFNSCYMTLDKWSSYGSGNPTVMVTY